MDAQNILPFTCREHGPNLFEVWGRQTDATTLSNAPKDNGSWDAKSEVKMMSKEGEREVKKTAGKRKKRCNRYKEVLDKSWMDFIWQKKTHIRKFRLRQQKHRRPSSLPYDLLTGPRFVRYGHFCGITDNRPTRCPFAGITREGLSMSCKKCTCQSFSIYPSPLASVVPLWNLEETLGSFFSQRD